jgi:hypothetical protein
MSEFKGTPGPWRLMPFSDSLRIDSQRSIVAFGADKDNLCMVCQGEDLMAKWEEERANAQLIAAAPELLKCLTDGTTVNLPELLDWVADRMVHVYGENENIDFVLTLRHRASVCRTAIAKALGETK